jgi:hypothetical protein
VLIIVKRCVRIEQDGLENLLATFITNWTPPSSLFSLLFDIGILIIFDRFLSVPVIYTRIIDYLLTLVPKVSIFPIHSSISSI